MVVVAVAVVVGVNKSQGPVFRAWRRGGRATPHDTSPPAQLPPPHLPRRKPMQILSVTLSGVPSAILGVILDAIRNCYSQFSLYSSS